MSQTNQTKKRKKRSISQCQKNLENGDKCSGKYRLEHEGAIPVFICDKCEDKELTWKKFYEEYLSIFKDKEKWNNKKDHVSCILGFFCFMYKEKYNTDYIFVPSNPNPFSAKECRDIWTLLSTFGGDAHETRRYIYWVFKKAINNTTAITSFGYLNAPGLIRKYKLQVERKNILTRASNLPDNYLEWCRSNIPSIFDNYALVTMNDLGALLGYYNSYKTELDDTTVEAQAINMASKYNLILNGKLNI